MLVEEQELLRGSDAGLWWWVESEGGGGRTCKKHCWRHWPCAASNSASLWHTALLITRVPYPRTPKPAPAQPIADGSLACWGKGGEGELGMGNSNNLAVPTVVPGGLVFSDISTGKVFSCGLLMNGELNWLCNGTHISAGGGVLIILPCALVALPTC